MDLAGDPAHLRGLAREAARRINTPHDRRGLAARRQPDALCAPRHWRWTRRGARWRGSSRCRPRCRRCGAWDEATAAISDASARASLLRSVHPGRGHARRGGALRAGGGGARARSSRSTAGLPTALAGGRLARRTRPRATTWSACCATSAAPAWTATTPPAPGCARCSEELVQHRPGVRAQHPRGRAHASSSTRAELDGLPEDYVRAHPPGADGKVRITTDYPDYVPFMTYARDGAAREELWRVVPPARPPEERGGAAAHAGAPPRAGARCSATATGPPTSPRTR